jgi:hypothetical protein
MAYSPVNAKSMSTSKKTPRTVVVTRAVVPGANPADAVPNRVGQSADLVGTSSGCASRTCSSQTAPAIAALCASPERQPQEQTHTNPLRRGRMRNVARC